MENETKTLQKQVEYVLENCPETRNSDKLLSWRVWEQFYLKDHPFSINLADFMQLPSQASIQRIRAKLQNVFGRYLPTDEKIAKQRKMQIEVWRKQLGYE